jgi:hypothetical protein
LLASTAGNPLDPGAGSCGAGGGKSGIALRFPRIARWRSDKPAREADRLAQVHALLPDAVQGRAGLRLR